jgi:hypothetical protein
MLLLLGLAGCESPDWARSMRDQLGAPPETRKELIEQYRQDYAATHNRRAMRWLLGHCVESGMTYPEVCKVFGEDGDLETHDRQFKSNGGNYQVGDEMYAWKDDQGRVVYLAFRDSRLVNFEQSEFR